MAHQAHNIPWTLLASNLRWVDGSSKCDVCDFRPRFQANQGKELTYFAKAFARNVEEHSICERRKYPEKYDPPSSTTVVVDGKTAAKIRPTVRRWRDDCARRFHETLYDCDGKSCGYERGSNCQCPVIPHEERTVSAFCRHYEYPGCYRFFEQHKAAFFNVELVKTLILYGDMEPILRVCAHPDVAIGSWWDAIDCQCVDDHLGWDQICEKALMAYICLNTIQCFPKLWDRASGKIEKSDYRNSRTYQLLVKTLTQPGDSYSAVVTYPHRRFFGIGEDHDHVYRKHVYGREPFHRFLALECLIEDEHSILDTDQVRSMLCFKGLPVELALDIMEFADYTPKRRLNVPHDPFHPSNRNELDRYIKYCWQLLVRCDMMARELDMKINWEDQVTYCICQLWEARDLYNRILVRRLDDDRVVFV